MKRVEVPAMISRIYIDGYKSLRRVELKGLANLVVLFGANGSGKSNLLDALDLLARLAHTDTVAQAFQRHRGNRGPRPLPIRQFFTTGADATNRIVIEVDLHLQEGLVSRLNGELDAREAADGLTAKYTRVHYQRLRYRIEIYYDDDARSLVVTHESLVAITEGGEVRSGVKPFIAAQGEGRSLSVKLERQSHPRTFALPRQRTVLSELADLVNHPHVVATAAELAGMTMYYIEPTTMRGEVLDIEAKNPGPNGQTLASFYHWLQRTQPVRFKNLEVNLARLVPGLEGIRIDDGHDGFLSLWAREAGRGEIPASLLSEGTLRLLCLTGVLAAPSPPPVVGYEEPENGVHPARLGEMLDIIELAAQRGDLQIVLTTHSREVLDRLEEWPCFRAARAPGRSEFVRGSDLPLLRRIEAVGAVGRVGLGTRVARGDLD